MWISLNSYKTDILYCYETFLPGTCWKKFPIMSKVLRFHGFPVTKVHNVSCGPVKKVIFSFGQCNICGLDSPNLCTYLSIQNVYANYNILGTLKNFVLNRFGQCNFCSFDSPNFHTYLSIQYVYANYNILFRWIHLPYFQLTKKLIRCFVSILCTLSEHVLHWLRWFSYSLTAALGFWEPCWELFSVNKPVLH